MRKICSKCKIEKEFCEFYFRKKRNKFTSQCKQCLSEKNKKYWVKKKEVDPEYDKKKREKRKQNRPNELKEYRQKWYLQNKEYWKKYRDKNIDKQKEYSKNYYEKNKKSLNQYVKEWRQTKSKNDQIFRLINSCRSAVNRYLKNKKYKTFDLIGCTPLELIEYIEKKFVVGMTWDNHGKYGWHIDHIVPLSSAKTNDELYKLCHYTNLQPLWAIDNIRKKNKI